MTLTAERERALNTTLSQIEKQFGKGAIMRLGRRREPNAARSHLNRLNVGGLSFGRGRCPQGPHHRRYMGRNQGVKPPFLCTSWPKHNARVGWPLFVDAEHALDPNYAKALGVDTDELLVSQPDTGEQALEITELLVRSGAVDVIVVDSVAALVPRAEIEGEMGDSHVGLQARLMSQALRKLTGVLSKSHTTAIFINQIREKIGVLYGNPETTPGGRALKFYSSVRLEVRRKGGREEQA